GLFSNSNLTTTQSDIDLITNTTGTGIAVDILKRDPNPKYLNTLLIRIMQINPQVADAAAGYAGLGFEGVMDTLDETNRLELLEGKYRPLDFVEWNQKSVTELRQMIELIKSKNIKLTGIYGPVSTYYSEQRIKNYVDYMREIFNSYGF